MHWTHKCVMLSFLDILVISIYFIIISGLGYYYSKRQKNTKVLHACWTRGSRNAWWRMQFRRSGQVTRCRHQHEVIRCTASPDWIVQDSISVRWTAGAYHELAPATTRALRAVSWSEPSVAKSLLSSRPFYRVLTVKGALRQATRGT